MRTEYVPNYVPSMCRVLIIDIIINIQYDINMNDRYKDFPPEIHPSNYVMKGNPPKTEQPPQMAITEAELATLWGSSKEELITLVVRVSGAMWGIGLKSKEEIAEAFKLKLAIGGMTEKDMFKALPIMREWFDREMGKAAQSIAMTVEDKGISKLSDDRLLRLERELARMTGQEAVVIAPEPKKLDVVMEP